MAQSYEHLIRQVLDYLQMNLSESVDLGMLCEHVNCSKSWLIKIFVKHTGKGPFAHLADLRLQKAKDLLRNTNLNISEIAGASGFKSPAYFGIAFKKATQLSPSEFRQGAGKAIPTRKGDRKIQSSPRPWFFDSMVQDPISTRWRCVAGDWVQENGCACGSGEEEYTLELMRLLPDNFRLSFEMNLESIKSVPTSPVRLHLCDQTTGSAFYHTILHDLYGGGSSLRRGEMLVAESSHPRIKEGVWTRISVGLNDEFYSLHIGEEESISFRDPFPAPYERRCRFRIGGFRSRFRLRNVQIDDLGFLAFSRATRQADALYNSGLLDEARRFYERMFKTESNPADEAELCTKISLCCLGQRDYCHAREWAQKVPPVPATDFWVQQTALVLLETEWREDRIEEMRTRILSLSKRPQIRCRLKGIVQQAAADLDNRGFFEEGLLLRNTIYEIEEPNSAQSLGSLAMICESLLKLNRLESTAAHLRELAEQGRAFPRVNEYWLFTLVNACNILGKTGESKKVIEQLRKHAWDEVTQARCDVYQAFVLQAEGALEEALDILREIPAKHPHARFMSAFAGLSASLILVSAARPHEALEVIAQVEKSYATRYLSKGVESRYRFPPLFAKGEFRKAAEILLTDSSVEPSSLALHAGQAIEAALIYAISGDTAAARNILEEIQRRFPEKRVRYYARLAAALKEALEHSSSPGWAGHAAEVIENLPYPARDRGEILYLSGYLFLQSGEASAGRRLLSRIGQEDRSNGWPVVLAGKLLESSKSNSGRS